MADGEIAVGEIAYRLTPLGVPVVDAPVEQIREVPAAALLVDRLRDVVTDVHVDATLEKYILTIVQATRDHPDVSLGASPRGSLALDRSSRVHAWLAGRDHVTPEDVRAVAHDCLRHRIMPGYEAGAEGVTTHDIVSEIVKVVAVP
mgnify:CR=1 FL=1